MRLTGKKALITGAGGGIGRAAALAFAREGAAVACCDIRQEPAEATAEAVRAAGGTAVPVIADLTAEDAAREGVEAAERQLGGLNAVFNNAGLVHPGDHGATDTPLAAWEATLAVNLTGVFLVCKFAIPALLRAGGGAVVNNASIVALVGSAYPQIAYTAAKGGVAAMTRELAVVYARQGLRFNAVCPARPARSWCGPSCRTKPPGPSGAPTCRRDDWPPRRRSPLSWPSWPATRPAISTGPCCRSTAASRPPT